MKTDFTRRDMLKLSALGAGSAVVAGGLTGCPVIPPQEVFPIGEPLDENEMRITFMGTSVVPRQKQECNSVFVEVGSGDSFVFDCGSGVCSKYNAMGVTPARMDKIFLTHLHGDHTSDIVTIYCFGPSQDRKWPLQVWGPSGDSAEDGTNAFCANLARMMHWHIESFSFGRTGTIGLGDGYDIIPTELPYMTVGGVAYDNPETGVRITHFPAVHCRNGSISYKLEWNGMSMIFSGDTKPNDYMIQQGQGVDVLIHEMVVPPEVWASKNSGLKEGDPGYPQALAYAKAVQDSSHTPQKALGYIFAQTRPRLGVPTHFQVNPDTVGPAMEDIRLFYDGPVTIATDLLVLNVSKEKIRQRTAIIDEWAWYAQPIIPNPATLMPPRYPSPTAQLSEELLSHSIPEELYDPQVSAKV
ncbi:MAG TPA: guanitoxin biosynthesis MBL fold metallo-hydrolase GntH [Candidatus Hydrogenedentes bacterium]|jgi:ribonuclease Z|nr:MAG: Ribonuclease BN [Candidatus Hydrogenedentes bacterium ADurb.Bin170]HNZ49652.1 guanitoxin biosynthesis MBL fold metallo-hydrolase GntH [Candidatus Hydrogenedentota bacterium]HOD96428.1 guanitoxin biosynthesis MBL fold metallo-hydrolase GntH [Candidatus Hydrogenedentota bacterium]HOR51698.1 guanitoxin biosynthesis MBL fold metallo-hydrolase GntH [Candidatus Hydrogenedentota bacterium]HPK25406.1 guanitoxin biosynthesis MBL fold metallo-hydrolase GntH [Candidatus Hydrogenedentota bacterium]